MLISARVSGVRRSFMSVPVRESVHGAGEDECEARTWELEDVEYNST
jgi:hypothetical protein